MPILYSQRMLNPFHGIVNVLELYDADAVSRDGVNWALFIRGDREFEEGENGTLIPVETPDIKFGDWSREQGLRRAPVRFVTDYDRLDALGMHLLEAVREHSDELPFPLCDHYEFWLLHGGSGLPLALLDSACNPMKLEMPYRPAFRAGIRSRTRFVQNSEEAVNPDNTDRSPSERLEKIINAAAGHPHRAQWFKRGPDGSGIGLEGVNIDVDLEGRHLDAEDFPELLIRDDLPNAEEVVLIRDYLDWQAPWLLQLQFLTEASRALLEQVACRQVHEIAKYYLLYPEVIDQERITAAMVESRLRCAHAAPKQEEEEEPLYPFGNE